MPKFQNPGMDSRLIARSFVRPFVRLCVCVSLIFIYIYIYYYLPTRPHLGGRGNPCGYQPISAWNLPKWGGGSSINTKNVAQCACPKDLPWPFFFRFLINAFFSESVRYFFLKFWHKLGIQE